MNREWHGKIFVLALMGLLAGCGQAEQSPEVEATAAAEPDTAPATEMTDTPAMPEGLEISGRFADMFVAEVTDDFNPGLAVGDEFPPIRALYNGEEITSIDDFIGENGAIFIAVRSVDWCPYCRRQLAQLQGIADDFEAAGIGMISITYDSPELQQMFIELASLGYPLVSDVDAESVKALGILNDEYAPGDENYGIPYPGVFVINPDKQIVGKIFVERYQIRVDAPTTLAYAKELLGAE